MHICIYVRDNVYKISSRSHPLARLCLKTHACMFVCIYLSKIFTHTHTHTHTAVARRKESAAPDCRRDTWDFPAQPGRNSRGITIITNIIIIIMIHISLSTQAHAEDQRRIYMEF
jgi:Ca2+/H+ antiporter